MKTNLALVIVGLMVALVFAGCEATGKPAATAAPVSKDPDARAFTGVIVRLIPETSTMGITKEERVGRDRVPSMITVKYDAQTKFFLDNQPTTLMDISQYMTVSVEGHMRDGQMFAETARFSSAMPGNAKHTQASN